MQAPCTLQKSHAPLARSYRLLNDPHREGLGVVSMRAVVLVALSAILLSACAIQRAQEAQDARALMVGLSKEQVLGCMGPPINKATEGATEVWTYNSGNGMTIAGGSVSGGSFSAISSNRFCTVNVVMTKGQVTAVNYTGPTGGLLTAGEQCAYAVDACAKAR
jgi:hypothetical protein